jgi:hypothetical protein
VRAVILGGLVATLASCGGIGSGDSGLFGRRNKAPSASSAEKRAAALTQREAAGYESNDRRVRKPRSTFFDLFRNNADPNVTVEVNKYLW